MIGRGEDGMAFSHEPWLVVLSVVMAFQGSYVGLHLARQVQAATGTRQRALMMGAALTLALGIWSMHFVGMLAVRLSPGINFLVLPTLLSFLVCVLVVGFAVFAVGMGPPGVKTMTVAALAMGAGIVTMHFLGMWALHDSMSMVHSPWIVAASVAIGVLASGSALWLGFGKGSARPIGPSAVVMALAISAMHYTAMSGLTMQAHEMAMARDVPMLSSGLLAIIVSIVAFIVSSLFLLSLVPARQPADAIPEGAARFSEFLPRAPVAAGAALADREDRAAATPSAEAPPEPPEPPAERMVRSLPVEREGRRRKLDIEHILAVQAQTHYTQLFDGESTWFCPMAISEVEALLDPSIFVRVHRSHIVNLKHVATVRRTAEAAFVAMTGTTPYRAPVSRSRLSILKQRLEQYGAALQ